MTESTPDHIQWIPCGGFANVSEEEAVKAILEFLQNLPDKPRWLILSNVMVAARTLEAANEVDVVAIGPKGVLVIEIKHWDRAYIERHVPTAEAEAHKVEMKARKLAGLLRQRHVDTWVQACILLTKERRPGLAAVGQTPTFTLSNLDALFGHLDSRPRPLTHKDQNRIAAVLNPTASTRLSGRLQAFAGIENLTLVSPPHDRFHRVYAGVRIQGRERVFLHWFDLTATGVKQAENIVRRAYESYLALQKEPFVPRIVDSLQPAPDYAGEIFFYTVEDPGAPPLKDRARDSNWTASQRVRFASRCAKAVRALHFPEGASRPPLIHRALSPSSILVTSDDSPILTGFELARIHGFETISTAHPGTRHGDPWTPPEIAEKGLGAADGTSDVYALCASLATALEDVPEAMTLLSQGMDPDPAQRIDLKTLEAALDDLYGRLSAPEPADREVAAEFWSEGTVVGMADRENSRTGYRIVAKLGTGGMGTSYKAVEIDRRTREELGLYVLKTVHRADDAEAVLTAYRRARPHVGYGGSAKIYEIASEWVPSRPAAVLEWVAGAPLSSYAGILELHAADVDRTLDDLLLGWISSLCRALSVLHRNGLVHGDVSPSNIIVDDRESRVTLTDYDGVTPVGQPVQRHNPAFASPSVRRGMPASPADDIVALAASFYTALTEKAPFTWGATVDPSRGLDLSDAVFAAIPRTTAFLRRATSFDNGYRDADDVLADIESGPVDRASADGAPEPVGIRRPQVVPRLRDILSVYPGSRYGNQETRGLDSPFALETYVPTELDDQLLSYVQDKGVHLVILLGNAGDGKTALLQRLVTSLSGQTPSSSERIWDLRLDNGRRLYVNLDGSAAYRGRSAADLLDEFFAPFLDGMQSTDNIRILAINSGPLKQWLAGAPPDSRLVQSLTAALAGEELHEPAIRVIDLNDRSLVGHFAHGPGRATFVDDVLSRFLGDNGAVDPWEPCRSCSAQERCVAYGSVTALRDPRLGSQIRTRLVTALQMVHQRGEVHITARELRALLSFGFFGTDSCQDLHQDPDLKPAPFYERLFDPATPHRQGELLAELAWLDPALEVEPERDRMLLKQGGNLASLRRQAYFLEPDPAHVPLLHQSRYYNLFRQAAMADGAPENEPLKLVLKGLSALGSLPKFVLREASGLCLQVPARVETETVFWVEKDATRFHLRVPAHPNDLAWLPTRLDLVYASDRGEEVLPLTLDLFEFLLGLADGSQLAADPRSVDVHARLAVFLQRLAEEDRRRLYAWTPLDAESVYVVEAGGSDAAALVHIAPRRSR